MTILKIEIDWVTEFKNFMPTVSCACNIKVLFLYIPCFALCKTCIIMHWIKMQEAGEFVYVNPFCVLVSLIQIKHFVKNFVQTIFLFIRGICTIGWSEYQKIDFSETWCSDSRMDLFKNLYIVIFHFRGGGGCAYFTFTKKPVKMAQIWVFSSPCNKSMSSHKKTKVQLLALYFNVKH